MLRACFSGWPRILVSIKQFNPDYSITLAHRHPLAEFFITLLEIATSLPHSINQP